MSRPIGSQNKIRKGDERISIRCSAEEKEAVLRRAAVVGATSLSDFVMVLLRQAGAFKPL